MDVTNLTSLVTALRAETAYAAITPESLGSILQKMVDAIGQLGQVNMNASNVLEKIEELTTSVNELKTSEKSIVATAKGYCRYSNVDALKTTRDVGQYVINSTGKVSYSGLYGILIVSANYAPWIQQYYFGCLNPNDWSGNALDANIYTRTFYDNSWSEWKKYRTS